ncbi:MAG: FAD-dependent oxidoreductase [Propionibacteriaceae bacterium]|nr:FAD-dependent oxidoreductase [Propionibacteriaceae bacterium]
MDTLYDAVIVGGGPAGLTAAIYLARARYRVLVVEKDVIGGQITITADVVNYPGIVRASGEEITSHMRQQAINFGAEFLAAEVTGYDMGAPVRTVRTTTGDLRCFGIILAVGASPKTVGFVGEAEFKGHGVAYCATCDGEFFTGLDVFVVGGGLAAAEEAIFLTTYARHVTILIRRDEFRCPGSVVEKVEANPKITVRYNTVIDEVTGDSVLRTARLRSTLDGTTEDYAPPAGETFGVFVFAGYAPATAGVRDLVDLDDAGYILTDAALKTKVDGVYAAGDVRPKTLRQMVTATSDGAIAATELERYISHMREETGLTPEQPAGMPVAQAAAPVTEPTAGADATSEGGFSQEIRDQLTLLFSKMESPIELRAHLDDRDVSAELRGFLTELVSFSDKLTLTIADPGEGLAPCVSVWKDGRPTGVGFHGVPGGHEFNSFVIGLYNAAGPGQALDEATTARIAAITAPIDIKVFVSLSCTMCPTTVMSAQHIATLSPNVTAEAFDLNHFPALRQQYSVMSVPCMVVNDADVHFGKMSVTQVLDALGY